MERKDELKEGRSDEESTGEKGKMEERQDSGDGENEKKRNNHTGGK